MKRFNVAVVLMAWWGVAYAQIAAEIDFLDQIEFYPLKIWAFIAAFSAFGFLMRLAIDHTPKKPTDLSLDNTGFNLVLSFGAGFFAFTFIHWGWRAIPVGWRPPFATIGVGIVIASMSSRRTIELVTTTVFSWLGRKAKKVSDDSPSV